MREFKLRRSILMLVSWVSLVLGPLTAGATEILITADELIQKTSSSIERVEQLAFIRKAAEDVGARAFLFGGSAAAFLHYLKQDIQRERGDLSFSKDRFDYDWMNIFRANQDADIVIDGNPEQLEKIRRSILSKYPHMQGDKEEWELRLLRQTYGTKMALLDNPDFLLQHTDSHSVGLVEITAPQNDEPRIRDLRAWKVKEPPFLKDVVDGRLHYYFSKDHGKTSRAREGKNPAIFSVVRYLIKAFQFSLNVRKQDLQTLLKIIQDFDPRKDLQTDYSRNWIEKNARKLFENAENIEFAWNSLEQLGLREKLASFGEKDRESGLGYLMKREPLRSFELGRGNGKTAAELELDIVAHETRSFLAYESITKSRRARANVFISRKASKHEGAMFGDGFYTRVGREGAVGSGITIRFHLNPLAREGTDFIYVKESDFVVVKNKKALQLIDENISLGPLEFLQLCLDQSFLWSDRGLMMKLQKRVQSKKSNLTEDTRDKILQLLESAQRRGLKLSSVYLEETLGLLRLDPVRHFRALQILSKAFLATTEDDRLPIFQAIMHSFKRTGPNYLKAATDLLGALLIGKHSPSGDYKGLAALIAELEVDREKIIDWLLQPENYEVQNDFCFDLELLKVAIAFGNKQVLLRVPEIINRYFLMLKSAQSVTGNAEARIYFRHSPLKPSQIKFKQQNSMTAILSQLLRPGTAVPQQFASLFASQLLNPDFNFSQTHVHFDRDDFSFKQIRGNLKGIGLANHYIPVESSDPYVSPGEFIFNHFIAERKERAGLLPFIEKAYSLMNGKKQIVVLESIFASDEAFRVSDFLFRFYGDLSPMLREKFVEKLMKSKVDNFMPLILRILESENREHYAPLLRAMKESPHFGERSDWEFYTRQALVRDANLRSTFVEKLKAATACGQVMRRLKY